MEQLQLFIQLFVISLHLNTYYFEVYSRSQDINALLSIQSSIKLGNGKTGGRFHRQKRQSLYSIKANCSDLFKSPNPSLIDPHQKGYEKGDDPHPWKNQNFILGVILI